MNRPDADGFMAVLQRKLVRLKERQKKYDHSGNKNSARYKRLVADIEHFVHMIQDFEAHPESWLS
jgi:hypothetical protein